MSIKIALAGNPNCGKTTLFNALTGSNQYVGNWPGVTVEKKEGRLKGNKDVVVMDLPGIYSLSPYTLEEVVARNYLITERPDAILNIIDGTNLERNLYLTTQLTELGIPVVIAVNMLDILEKKGDIINIQELSQKVGCPVYEISALKGKGIKEAAEATVKATKEGNKLQVSNVFTKNIEDILDSIAEKLPSDIPEEQKRFYAIKLFERDNKILGTREDFPDVEAIIADAEQKFDDDSESIITNERYTYISRIIKGCFKKKSREKLTRSDKIDRIVTNRWFALPIFAIVMIIVYYVSVTSVGTLVTDFTNDQLFGEDGWYLFGIGRSDYEVANDEFVAENIFCDELTTKVQNAVNKGVIGADEVLIALEKENFDAFEEAVSSYEATFKEAGIDISLYYNDEIMEKAPKPADYGIYIPGITTLVGNGLEAINCIDWLSSLIVDGIIGGVGAVLGFVPQMLVLFIFLAFLESCGYMARIAFIMDRIFRKFGLSGKSFIPILIGTGCGVPGIMASRTIEHDRDRKMTIMITTFIPCGAKFPSIALIATALFGGAWWVAPSAYFLGIAAIIISGIILKKTKMFAGNPAPFIMELPAYHFPTAGAILRSMWERGWSFVKKAGTIILLSSIIIWAGSSFGMLDGSFGFSTEMELSDSVLGMIGNALCWIFAPLGFGEATAAIATIMGFVAKEEVVGVFGVLDFAALGTLAGYSFLTFNLLCAPCFAAIGAIRREMNSVKWTWFAIGYQCVFAYATSFVIYQLGMLFSGYFDVFTIIGSIFAFAIIALTLYLLIKPYKENTKFTQNVKVRT